MLDLARLLRSLVDEIRQEDTGSQVFGGDVLLEFQMHLYLYLRRYRWLSPNVLNFDFHWRIECENHSDSESRSTNQGKDIRFALCCYMLRPSRLLPVGVSSEDMEGYT